MSFPTLPTVEPRRTDETLQAYGSRVLQFLLATGCTATLSDEDLQLADHIALYAVASRDISNIALIKINETRHVIASILRGRQAYRDGAAHVPAASDNKPNEGPMARLQDRPIVRPPSGQKVEIAF